MPALQIRHFTPADIPQVVALQKEYSQTCPGAPVIPGEVYLSPGFHGGRDVFCAVDDAGRLWAYAPLFASPAVDPLQEAHVVWAEVKANPQLADPIPLKDLLFERIINQAQELARQIPRAKIHLTFQYYPSESASVDYVLSKGCCYTESIFRMSRDLTLDLPQVPPPQGICIRRWRMESEAEQRRYVAARNEAFPEAIITLADWQYFLLSPQWATGTAITAFDGDEVSGSVTAFWDETENQSREKKAGYTEYIFVRPAWRKQGIARCLVREGLAYLKEHGLDEAHLEVRSRNPQALDLYLGLGYRVTAESRLYVLEI